MNGNDIVLILLTAIEFVNLAIRVIKLIPPREPKIDEYILRTMYI